MAAADEVWKDEARREGARAHRVELTVDLKVLVNAVNITMCEETALQGKRRRSRSGCQGRPPSWLRTSSSFLDLRADFDSRTSLTLIVAHLPAINFDSPLFPVLALAFTMGDVISQLDDELSIELFKNSSKTRIVDFSVVCHYTALIVFKTVSKKATL